MRAWNDPELSFSLGRKRVDTDEPGVSGDGTVWSVSLAQTFEWPGRQALRKAVADRDIALAELALEGFRTELAGRVRALAFRCIGARERARAVAEVAERFRALRQTFVAREPGGLTPQLEIRVIEAQELVLEQRAIEAQLETDAALIELNTLRGEPVDTPLELAAARLDLAAVPGAEHILELALQRNVDVRTRVAELERQGLRVTLANHERRPAVTLAPFFEEQSAVERERTVGLGVSIALPVGGRSRSLAGADAARLVQAEAVLRAARRELERDVHTQLHAYRVNREALERWPETAVAAFREAASIADRHYRLGAVPVGTYVELQTAYLDAVESVLALERSALDAAVALESLTAGAWRAAEVTP